VKRILVVALVAAVLVIALIVYHRRHSGSGLQVEPHAREEIEKAKHR
jgi:hypothetical protein